MPRCLPMWGRKQPGAVTRAKDRGEPRMGGGSGHQAGQVGECGWGPGSFKKRPVGRGYKAPGRPLSQSGVRPWLQGKPFRHPPAGRAEGPLPPGRPIGHTPSEWEAAGAFPEEPPVPAPASAAHRPPPASLAPTPIGLPRLPVAPEFKG